MSKQEKQPLVSSQPGFAPQGQEPPPYEPYTQQPGARLDNLAAQKLMAVNAYAMKQGRALGETVHPGCFSNRYMITDRHRMIQVPGREGKPDGMVETPLWIIQEKSDCCMRLCCCGKHPILAKFYHARPPTQGAEICCGMCYSGHRYLPDFTQPVVMTLERDGCCNKWIGCWICGEKCQSEAWLHAGEVEGRPGTIANQTSPGTVIGRSHVPKDVCFKPKLDVFDGPTNQEKQMGQMEGPCFFGGCLDLCCDTRFKLSSTNDGIGDVGSIWKEKPDSFCSLCIQAAGDVDNYSIELAPNQMTPEQKANYLATAVHLDYWFFQQDVRAVQCYTNPDGKSGTIIITFCNFFCKGMVCPVQCYLPYHLGK